MDLINSDILCQFVEQGVTINKGVAIDARLGKKGKHKKSCHDLASDWVVQKDVPHYSLNEHAAVVTNHGFILATPSPTTYLPYCTIFSRHTKQPKKKVPTRGAPAKQIVIFWRIVISLTVS
jgi:hypothetical protein